MYIILHIDLTLPSLIDLLVSLGIGTMDLDGEENHERLPHIERYR